MSARTTNDPDSSRSPLIECYDGDDDGDGWDAMEEIFTQHDQSLSQDIGDDIDSEEEEDNECEPPPSSSISKAIPTLYISFLRISIHMVLPFFLSRSLACSMLVGISMPYLC